MLSSFWSESVVSAGPSPNLGLSNIKLESPAYYCTSYTPPCSEPGLISSQYPTLSLPRSQSPHSGLADTSVIRVKRMRRMSSEGEETELRSGEGKVGDLYYSQSPLGQATSSWSQADLDQAASIGRFDFVVMFIGRRETRCDWWSCSFSRVS